MDALISSSESCSDLNSNACISLSANVYNQQYWYQQRHISLRRYYPSIIAVLTSNGDIGPH